jgi:hypothetical protein
MAGSDGTHERLLRQGNGIPLGYTRDNRLLLLQQVGGKLEVIKSGVGSEKEQVVIADAAPQATSLCEPAKTLMIIDLCYQNVTLAPDGHGLLLHAYYADGSHSLVYDDLAAGTSRKILNLESNASVQLPGWSQIAA